MAEEYRICLLCPERPVFDSEVLANIHARSAHPLIVQDAHPEEFFEVRHAHPHVSASNTGPFFCCYCENRVLQRSTAEAHATNAHFRELGGRDPQEGVDYVCEAEREQRQRRVQWVRDQDARIEGDRLARRLEHVAGVTDFLFECRGAG